MNQYEVRSALAKCGLMTKHIESLMKVLSGGEQAKVRLCKLINRETNLLLLDEPTNHLDVDAKEELKRALIAYKGSILLICHEPEFYEDIVTDVWNCEEWTTKALSCAPVVHPFFITNKVFIHSIHLRFITVQNHTTQI